MIVNNWKEEKGGFGTCEWGEADRYPGDACYIIGSPFWIYDNTTLKALFVQFNPS